MSVTATISQSAKTPSDNVEQLLYEKRQKIYPREVHGLFAGLRVTSVIILLGLFYGCAWLQWDGRQAVLWDLPARKFYIFGLVFWPQDFVYLTFMLIIAGLSLFFFTAIAGRLWCGYACPQTVWTESFLWIERMIEGDRSAQMRLDKSPWSFRKIRIKFTKHIIWILFSLFTGFTFVGYFTPIRDLAIEIARLTTGPWETFWVLFYAFATYGNAGWLREQVCIYMCPYARFQSAMFDRNTLIVSYDKARGEPRGPRAKKIDHKSEGLGDCIDCGLCKQVCPTGIDIRKGLQYECISCSACIDACDYVMENMDYPKGLIRYTTENELEGIKTSVLRPRIYIYGAILAAVIIGLSYSILIRVPLDMDIIRDRNKLYRETNDGLIENVYTLKILNKDIRNHQYHLDAEGIKNLQLILDKPVIEVDSGEVVSFIARIRASEDALTSRSMPVMFNITATDDKNLSAKEEARFLGPG